MRQFLILIMILFVASFSHAQQNIENSDSVKITTGKKLESDRNVMLNAEDNTSPREINVGLPASVGGMTIMEDNLPVVYYYWPDMPNRLWRQSVGLSRIGLMGLNESAATLGDIGYTVDSHSQMGTKVFKLKSKFTTNNFGWLQGDANISGPLGKGWGYSLGAFVNFDPGTTDIACSKYNDVTKIFRVGLTKYFNNNRGVINFLFKYSDSRNIHDYAYFRYEKGGNVTEMDNFKIGRDSYILRSGKVRFKDIISGEYYWSDIDSYNAKSVSNNFSVFGKYLLKNNWDLNFSTRLHVSKASVFEPSPTTVQEVSLDQGYTLADGTPYSGNVGTMVVQSSPRNPVSDIMGRFWFTKKTKYHDWNLGILEMFHKRRFTSNRTFYQQTLEPQPQLLFSSKTDEYGFYNYGKSAAYHKGLENKLSIYGIDKWNVNRNLSINYGLNIRYFHMNGNYSTSPRDVGFVLKENELKDFSHNNIHIGGFVGATYNITRNLGLMGNVQYTETNNGLESYNLAVEPSMKKSGTNEGAVGLFWNNKYIQLVSQLTYVRKNNFLKRFNFVNPNDPSDATNKSVYYDIQTVGWTTDFNFYPFKGAKLHFLFTLQNPLYKNFNFEVYGMKYDYNDYNVLSISKVLMEIDPSYNFGKKNEWRIWASFRYFSKQFANITNVLYFAPHWETFGGLDYKLNKNIKFSLSAVNFLNQRGAKGSINGSELVTDPTPYYGTLMTGSYIMPFTVRFSTSINF